ncbi:ABC transporter ATP-binding protein [Lentilactobacillus buchneri]
MLIPTSGQVIVDEGVPHETLDFSERMGLIIENTTFPKDLSGLQNLVTLSKINQVATIEDIKSAFERVGLTEDDWNMKVANYSLAMRQKLSIAQAIFERPKLLLLDEPTNGLDEESTWLLRKTLKEIADAGSTVILASHDKEDIAYLSDEVIHMDGGKIVN